MIFTGGSNVKHDYSFGNDFLDLVNLNKNLISQMTTLLNNKLLKEQLNSGVVKGKAIQLAFGKKNINERNAQKYAKLLPFFTLELIYQMRYKDHLLIKAETLKLGETMWNLDKCYQPFIFLTEKFVGTAEMRRIYQKEFIPNMIKGTDMVKKDFQVKNSFKIDHC
jgi:hypothetical protein